MKSVAITLVALLGAVSAFPGMGGESREQMLEMLKRFPAAAKSTSSSSSVKSSSTSTSSIKTSSSSSSVKTSSTSSSSSIKTSSTSSSAAATSSASSIISTLTEDIAGILGSVAANVAASDARPQPGYVFQAPGPGDSRGPCPGLNLLANYGYLPRNGLVTFGEVLNATAIGFNMATDLATVLAVFAVLADGDIVTESWYLGTESTGAPGGLNRHSTVECDVSPNREDYYLACGDNHHLSSRLFSQNVGIVAASASKQFDLTNMGSQYALNAAFSKTYNPYLYYFPFPLIVSIGGFAFYPNFFSNGTYEAGGVANYESVSSIIGAQYNSSTGHFEYVPEKWPSNWYRRSTPYGAVDTLVEGFVDIYSRNPIVPAIGQVGTANLSPATILCDILMGIESITPLILAGTEEEVAAAIAWALGKLDLAGINGTVLGCPTSSLSPVLYPNANSTGGPLAPPASVVSYDDNNVYNMTYFVTAPTTPQCSHTASS